MSLRKRQLSSGGFDGVVPFSVEGVWVQVDGGELGRSLGCEVALGEFSVLAGLCHLQRVHVDTLKIAPAVVGAALTDAVSERVVCAIVRLADSFGLHTVAEGVDDPEPLEHLRALGVDHARGGQLGQAITAGLLVAAPLRAAG